MEDTHGDSGKFVDEFMEWCSLNPYYNGRYSWSNR